MSNPYEAYDDAFSQEDELIMQALERDHAIYTSKGIREAPAGASVAPEAQVPTREASRFPIDDRMFQGFAGGFVRSLEPTTEADPVAMLATTLSLAGAIIGDAAHLFVSDTRHPPRTWFLITGATSNGRKGTSLGTPRRVFEAAFPEFMKANVVRGLSSGEGLIVNLQDRESSPDEDVQLAAPDDKRRFVHEDEWQRVMACNVRQGSTLSAVLRDCYDGVRLHVMTKIPVTASRPSVSIVGHITPDEFRANVNRADMAGGLYNRFMLIASRRSKRLPRMPSTPQGVVDELATELRKRIDGARMRQRVEFTPEAWSLWEETLYARLNPEFDYSGPVGEVLARGVPNVLRLALTYALLDGRDGVGPEHLTAAHALWNYVEATTKALFNSRTGNVDADRLHNALRASPEGLDRTAQHALFGNNKRAKELDLLVNLLVAEGLAVEHDEPTEGRTRRVLRINESDEITKERGA